MWILKPQTYIFCPLFSAADYLFYKGFGFAYRIAHPCTHTHTQTYEHTRIREKVLAVRAMCIGKFTNKFPKCDKDICIEILIPKHASTCQYEVIFVWVRGCVSVWVLRVCTCRLWVRVWVCGEGGNNIYTKAEQSVKATCGRLLFWTRQRRVLSKCLLQFICACNWGRKQQAEIHTPTDSWHNTGLWIPIWSLRLTLPLCGK